MANSVRLHQFSKTKPCYYCGAPPPSIKEHIPVKMMFQGFDCGRFTVPSCEEHNSKKQLSDKAVVSLHLREAAYGLKNGVSPNVLKALKHHWPKLKEGTEPTVIEQAKTVIEKRLLEDPSSRIDISLPHIAELGIVRNWLRQLTAGLVWLVTGSHSTGTEWPGAAVWSPTFLPDPDTGTLTDRYAADQLKRFEDVRQGIEKQAGRWWPGWSPRNSAYPPDIYRFDVSLLPYQELIVDGAILDVVFRHLFYGRQYWYVWFTTSRKTKSQIRYLLESLHN